MLLQNLSFFCYQYLSDGNWAQLSFAETSGTDTWNREINIGQLLTDATATRMWLKKIAFSQSILQLFQPTYNIQVQKEKQNSVVACLCST